MLTIFLLSEVGMGKVEDERKQEGEEVKGVGKGTLSKASDASEHWRLRHYS